MIFVLFQVDPSHLINEFFVCTLSFIVLSKIEYIFPLILKSINIDRFFIILVLVQANNKK